MNNKNKYLFKPYSSVFPFLFDKEKQRVAARLHNALSIEHIGSTAVPGLGGKGIIDILVAVQKGTLASAREQIEALGYLFKPFFSDPEWLYFNIDLPDPEEGTRRYHLHLTHPENYKWKELIEFRDYLRSHPEAVMEYEELKRRAALEANHVGERYREIKEPIFKKVKERLNDIEIGRG